MGAGLMKAHNNIFSKTFKEALKSTHRFRLGCIIIDKRGTILAKGFNQVKTHPLSNTDYKTLHAECDAARKLVGGHELYAYIGRIKKNGLPGLAKPCSCCQQLLKRVGVKYVWYSVSGSLWQGMEL